MALFSRRGTRDDSTPGPVETTAVDTETPDAAASADASAPAEPVPHVGISVSTFGSDPSRARPAEGRLTARPAATAPEPSQTVPGIVDNVLVQAALAALPEKPEGADIMNVMRQALQGQLYVRAQGDARALLESGQGVNLAITSWEDKRFLLVFTGGATLQESAQAEDTANSSALGQTAQNVFRSAVESGYDGVYLDHLSVGARLVLPIELVRKALEEGDPSFALKDLLAGPRDESTAAAVADALTRVKIWVAGGTDAEGNVGLAEARSLDGARRLEIYSHPLEVIAMGRGDRPLPLEAEQLAKTLAGEPGLTGVVVDAAGPWIELDRAALAPVLALAG